jgi:NAD(P)-dependent dehydrogenase (short-subunit alcohol dehydrogenase family)
LPYFSGLVNAAAITGPVGLLNENDVDEWIATIRVNLVGTMLPCRSALRHFRQRGYGKIVNFSGGGATGPRPRFSAYASAKAAVVRLTEILAYENRGIGIDINAIAPGAVITRMLSDVLNAGPEKAGEEVHKQALDQKVKGGEPPERAAQLCVRLLSSETDGLSGRLISAVWDDWNFIVSHRTQLATTDIYTLRRILPRDRGLNWE